MVAEGGLGAKRGAITDEMVNFKKKMVLWLQLLYQWGNFNHLSSFFKVFMMIPWTFISSM